MKLILSAIAMAVLAFTCCAPVAAQRRYSPDSVEVERVVNSGLKYLRSTTPDGSGRGVLKSLAIVAASKRYEGTIPTDDPFIQATVDGVRSQIASGRLLKAREVYHPCLACILLAELDADQYRSDIEKLLKSFEERQQESGGFTYLGRADWDTSQTQYVALAYFVARQHNLPVDKESCRRILEFLLSVQRGNTWLYSPKDSNPRISIHAAVSGTLYLLGDLLQLQPRVEVTEQVKRGLDDSLPEAISIFIPEPDPSDKSSAANWAGEGPLVDINESRFKEAKSRANSLFESIFTYQVERDRWKYYYMYAFERYAYFRQQAEGDVGNQAMRNWYDEGFEVLASLQTDDGSFPKGNPVSLTPPEVTTSFAILFLVRSSQLLVLPPSTSSLDGGNNLLPGKKLAATKNGRIQTSEASKSLDELLNSIDEDLSNDQLELLALTLKRAIREYQSKPQKSRGETQSFLRGLVKNKNYFKRLIAIKFLAGEQDLDNAPALIYALGDPDLRIAAAAHDGLRLISRKIDTISLPPNPQESDFASVKNRWTDWYLGIRPNAVLFD